MSTTVISTFQPLRHRAIAEVVSVLAQPWRERWPYLRPGGSLALALQQPNAVSTLRADDLLRLCRTDISLLLGVHVEQAVLLAYAPTVVAVGFLATVVAGGRATAGVGGDPVALLWPWGAARPAHENALEWVMADFYTGLAAMLNREWQTAIWNFQRAVNEPDAWRPDEAFILRQSAAANIALSVQQSHGG
jgi:hypothetical protein